jgi:hypothetical protein
MVDGKNKMSINRNTAGDFVKATIGAINLSLLSSRIFIAEKTQGFLDNCYYIEEFNWGYLVAIIVLILLMVKMMPFTKSYENIWVFLLTFISFLPLSIKVAFFLEEILFNYNNNFVRVIWFVILGVIIISVEEIVMGIVARFIWKNQIEFKDDEDKGYLQLCREWYESGDELEVIWISGSSDSEDDCYIEFLGRLN